LPEISYTKSIVAYLKEVVLQEDSFTIFSNPSYFHNHSAGLLHPSQMWHSSTEKSRKQEREVYYYTCKEKGHMSFRCPKNSGLYCGESKHELKTRTSTAVAASTVLW
jgi:hypothetical protein